MFNILWSMLALQALTIPAFAQHLDFTKTRISVTDAIETNRNHSFFSNPGYLLQADTLPRSFSRNISASPEKVTLSARSIIIPSAMIAYGAFTFSNKNLKKLNLRVRDELWEDRNGKLFHADNFSLVAPAVAVYALNIAGVKGKNNLVDASIIYGMSHLIGQMLIVSNVKKLTNIIPARLNKQLTDQNVCTIPKPILRF